MRCVALGVPIMRSPKPMKTGETRITGSGTACARAVIGIEREPPAALLTMVSVPLASPSVEELNPTLIEHEAPGARFSGQLLTTVHGAVAEVLENVRTALPLLRSSMVWNTVGVPTV